MTDARTTPDGAPAAPWHSDVDALLWFDVEHTAPSPIGRWLLPGRHPAVFVSGPQLVTSPRP